MRLLDTQIKFALAIETDDGKGYYNVSDELLDEIFKLPHVTESDNSCFGPMCIVFTYDMEEFTENCIAASRYALQRCIEQYEKKQAKRRARKKAA